MGSTSPRQLGHRRSACCACGRLSALLQGFGMTTAAALWAGRPRARRRSIVSLKSSPTRPPRQPHMYPHTRAPLPPPASPAQLPLAAAARLGPQPGLCDGHGPGGVLPGLPAPEEALRPGLPGLLLPSHRLAGGQAAPPGHRPVRRRCAGRHQGQGVVPAPAAMHVRASGSVVQTAPRTVRLDPLLPAARARCPQAGAWAGSARGPGLSAWPAPRPRSPRSSPQCASAWRSTAASHPCTSACWGTAAPRSKKQRPPSPPRMLHWRKGSSSSSSSPRPSAMGSRAAGCGGVFLPVHYSGPLLASVCLLCAAKMAICPKGTEVIEQESQSFRLPLSKVRGKKARWCLRHSYTSQGARFRSPTCAPAGEDGHVTSQVCHPAAGLLLPAPRGEKSDRAANWPCEEALALRRLNFAAAGRVGEGLPQSRPSRLAVCAR